VPTTSDIRSDRTHATAVEPSLPASAAGPTWKLFLASFVALFFELVIIRYLSTEIRAFAYLKNLPLIASFFGIGLGMIMGAPRKSLKAMFPIVGLVLFALIAFASPLNLTHIPLPRADYYVWGAFPDVSKVIVPLRFLGEILGILALVVAFFTLLGGIVGEYLAQFKPLPGYGINLLGSFAGVMIFTLLAFLRLPPVVWILLGFLCLVPFFKQKPLALVLFLITVIVAFRHEPNTFWSPYYRIDLEAQSAPPGWPQAPAYELRVNHDFHQHILDVSDNFLSRYPGFEPNHSAHLNYQIPYLVVAHPQRVLVVGAGTGNDVASALRHGVEHVDAVEIDPVIIELGKQFHPEHPYDSPRVTIYNDDARAFFKKTHQSYDLIVFGFLDSHTLVSSFSSVRLDNFVYTRESFQEAGSLLRPGGAIVVAFSAGRSFIPGRMYATLDSAFGVPPQVYDNGYVEGLTYVVRKSGGPQPVGTLHEISDQFSGGKAGSLVATDHWPFLYLANRRIPKSMLWVLALFLIGTFFVLRQSVSLPSIASRQSLHLFLLGAGFLLLETKGVTELSLLFGSTWTVNAVVIATFLGMGLLANVLVMSWRVPRLLAYAALFALLVVSLVMPYSMFGGLSVPLKILAAAVVVGLPVFFSGMIFSQSFRGVAQPAQGLGINLFGAVVGGTLENAVMIGGTVSLGILAIVLYGLSAFFAGRSEAPSA
jgi:SAM-dependent methyltransferase